MGKGDDKIYWKDLLWLILTITLISSSVSLGALAIHSKTPHKGAVTQREMDIFSDNTDRRLLSIERKLDILISKNGENNGFSKR